ncbi:MAG: TULIP family P47-like protein, partial [Bacteroidota bacterium]
LNLTPKLDENAKYAWIKPTGTSYAVTDNGTLENSVFGVLTITQGHPAPTSHEVSPNAIPAGGKANAGFLISGTSFMRNMMLAGARTIFDDAPETAFDIANDGLTVTNNTELTWGRFKKDDSATASVSNSYVSQLDQKQLPADMVNDLFNQGLDVAGFTTHVSTPGVSWWLASSDKKTEYLLDLNGDCIDVFNSIVFTIEKQQFKMSLDNSYLEIQFIDLLYPEDWEYDVHINYTEQVAMGLQTIGGKPRFWFNEVTKDMTVNVTKTQTGITVAIVEAAVLAVISLIAVVAPLIDGIRAAASIGEVTEEAGSALIDSEAFSDVEESLSEEEIEENEGEGLNNGTEQVGGKWTAFKNAFTATRWKVLGGITAIIGAGVATEQAVEAILQDISKNNWEKVPAFDEFANTAIGPYSWPGVAEYNLDSAQLAASLQVGLETVPEKNDQDANTAS